MHAIKPTLTEKSKETLELLKQGYTAKEIAEQQRRSRMAVEGTLVRLKKRFGCRSTIQLVAMYAEGTLAA